MVFLGTKTELQRFRDAELIKGVMLNIGKGIMEQTNMLYTYKSEFKPITVQDLESAAIELSRLSSISGRVSASALDYDIHIDLPSDFDMESWREFSYSSAPFQYTDSTASQATVGYSQSLEAV